MSRVRQAQLVAAAIEVQCPHCGDPQPSPDNGSHMWLIGQVQDEAAREPNRACVACDEPFRLIASERLRVSA